MKIKLFFSWESMIFLLSVVCLLGFSFKEDKIKMVEETVSKVRDQIPDFAILEPGTNEYRKIDFDGNFDIKQAITSATGEILRNAYSIPKRYFYSILNKFASNNKSAVTEPYLKGSQYLNADLMCNQSKQKIEFNTKIFADKLRPNIILLMADDLGHGLIGSYGQKKIFTPHIDRLAAEGILFTNSYSGSSACAPSRSVLMTGLHTGHTPIRWNTPGGATLEDRDITLAEQLKTVGYRTGGFGKWGLGKENTPGHPNRQGFDEFFGQYDHVHAHFYYPWWVWHNEHKVMLPENDNGKFGTYVHDITHSNALDFIRSSVTTTEDSPFFAYLPYIIPHLELIVPEDSKEAYLGKFPKHTIQEKREGYLCDEDSYTTYAGMISRLDDAVGEILALLVELDIDDNTLFIFTSDNGAQGSRWKDLLSFFDSTGGLRGSKGSLYEGGIRVPMIARWPGRIRAKRTSTVPIAHYDLFPTLVEIAGAEQIKTDGISLTDELFRDDNKSITKRPYLFWQTPGSCAVRQSNWKLIRTDRWLPWELYDLKLDPAETNNLANENRNIVFRLSRFAKSAYRKERDNSPTGPRTSHVDYVR